MGYDSLGKPLRRYVSAKKRTEVVKKLKNLRRKIDDGLLLKDEDVKVAELFKRWFEAVIDKDLATAVIARDFGADVMLILTDVPGIFRDYGSPEQRVIRLAMAKELRLMTFSEDSMGPKIEAPCRFVESTGQRAVIGMLDQAQGLLAGASGTTVVLDTQAHPQEETV
jgi:carbamate kinase